jgi:hypothetical protein
MYISNGYRHETGAIYKISRGRHIFRFIFYQTLSGATVTNHSTSRGHYDGIIDDKKLRHKVSELYIKWIQCHSHLRISYDHHSDVEPR